MTNWKNKTVLVTGGLGFIGSHLVKAMIERGSSVIVVDNSKLRPSLFKKKLDDYVSNCKKLKSRPDFHDIDLQFTPNKFRKLASQSDVIFHLAAFFGGRGFVETQQAECSAMFAVDQNVFRIAVEEGVKRLHYASSACVYPNELQKDRKYLLREEDANPIHGWESADNIYGWAKLLGERQIKILHQEKGLTCSTCRFLTVYGPHEYDDSHAIAALINRSIRKEDPFVVWGDGLQERGFTYVSDIVDGIIRATEVVTDGTPLNLGVDWRVTIKRVVELIHSYLEFFPEKVVYDDSKPVGPISRALDISKTKNITGWTPRVSIEKGLRQTIEWHQRNYKFLGPKAFAVRRSLPSSPRLTD
jgi:nucleoside-diphosphate-sugar epimerase